MSGTPSTHDSFAFIQARLGSTRFPKKILKSIPEGSNLTFLDHIQNRLTTLLDKEQIVFLIPENDEETIQFLKGRGYLYFCGSETDVRERYRSAAKQFGAKHIIRLTGDNPFVDVDSIRYLYEAILEIREPYYSLSMVGLPLGMGVECFSAASLFYESNETNLERHKEHVSLHIKEFPEIHTQYRLYPPHLQRIPLFQEMQNGLISQLRITVDEKNDYDLICEIWKHLGETNPNFGVEEILSLYKSNPQIFSINSDVSQVTFSLPKPEKEKKKVNILYGNPNQFGYGHFERCKSLSIYLQVNGYDVVLRDTFHDDERDLPHIFDIREIEYPVRHSFYIDNLNHPPNKYNACFFLPHPSYVFSETVSKEENPDPTPTNLSYYSSPLSELNRGTKTIPGKILVYAGQLDETESNQIDDYLLQFYKQSLNTENPSFDFILRIGGKKPNNSKIHFQERISYTEFLREMNSAEWVCTYFGQTMMEAMAKGKKVSLLGISEVHTTLGEFAEKELGIPFIGRLSKLDSVFRFPNKMNTKNINLVRDAHIQILDWLNSLT
ncbi:spore coat biosynthesis protein F [Leptospira kemamanensis]|uniref:Spore coat biosynthesis protein F n=1 Tax=Leptospira kemamanensis TaxID=2484942 RepID=A0A4R9JLA3_9LEPT|nr:spore coat biosynthesis protein F [Leptospira kemamanensis]TGL48181.1 spore coat biosynthesis protein F [Leptospira kemamanensis]